jgi:hypothetical protein
VRKPAVSIFSAAFGSVRGAVLAQITACHPALKISESHSAPALLAALGALFRRHLLPFGEGGYALATKVAQAPAIVRDLADLIGVG